MASSFLLYIIYDIKFRAARTALPIPIFRPAEKSAEIPNLSILRTSGEFISNSSGAGRIQRTGDMQLLTAILRILLPDKVESLGRGVETV